MVEELLHSFCCFECNRLFAIGCVKGCVEHVSSVVAAGACCSLTPCRFHPFSKHPNCGSKECSRNSSTRRAPSGALSGTTSPPISLSILAGASEIPDFPEHPQDHVAEHFPRISHLAPLRLVGTTANLLVTPHWQTPPPGHKVADHLTNQLRPH